MSDEKFPPRIWISPHLMHDIKAGVCPSLMSTENKLSAEYISCEEHEHLLREARAEIMEIAFDAIEWLDEGCVYPEWLDEFYNQCKKAKTERLGK